jgi:hypothetical protein
MRNDPWLVWEQFRRVNDLRFQGHILADVVTVTNANGLPCFTGHSKPP